MKLVRITLLGILTLVVYVAVNQYFLCPRYDFAAPAPFRGSRLYNPYEHLDSFRRYKCNFHAHSRAWLGLTNGNGTEAAVWNRYAALDYDVHCISNYHCISRYNKTDSNYLPAYEHGYNMKKSHYMLLNGSRVRFGDYVFPQTLHNKQRLIHCLAPADTALLCINHPSLLHAFTGSDLSRLGGYHCLEVLRGNHTHSYSEWDAALSAGRPVFLMASDDLHDIHNPREIGRNCTFVYAASVRAADIVTGLKAGRSYGMLVGTRPDETFEEKQMRLQRGLPGLHSVTVSGDSLFIKLTMPASEIRFIGQDGMLLATQKGNQAVYVIKNSDTYVRTHITFDDGTVMLLNPVFRFEEEPFRNPLPPVNRMETLLMQLTGMLLLTAYAVVLYFLLRWSLRLGKIRQKHIE